MKTEGTLIYHKIPVAMGLLQNNAYGHELVLFCFIIPCVHCLLVFYFYKKWKWLFWFCIHRHRPMQSIARSYTLTTKSDLALFSPVTSSDEDIFIFRGYYVYYCRCQLAERPVRHGIICEKSGKRTSQTQKAV